VPSLKRTHPDQAFFCIGPSSRMRMTPARSFPTPNSLLPRCADEARRRRVSLRRPPHVVYTGLRVTVLVAARRLGLFPRGTAAPDPAGCPLLSRWPDIRHANGEDARRHAARHHTSQPSNQLAVWMPAQYFESLPLVWLSVLTELDSPICCLGILGLSATHMGLNR
jgi:hypothetical protein